MKLLIVAVLVSLISSCSSPKNIYYSKECQFYRMINMPLEIQIPIKTKRDIAANNVDACKDCGRFQGTIKCKKIIKEHNKKREKLNDKK